MQLTLVSPNGDASGAKGSLGCPNGCTGYPAQLTVTVTYTLNNQGQLGIHYKATNNDKKLSTVLNLTNHSYFNLAGEASSAGSAYRQFVQINANRYSPTDSTLIPLPLAHGVVGRGHADGLPQRRTPSASGSTTSARRTTSRPASRRPPGARASCSSPRARPQLDPEHDRGHPALTASTWPPVPSTREAAGC